MSKVFNLEISSWENDGDENNVTIIEDLTAEDVAFYTELCQRFKSKNAPDSKNGLGNQENSPEVYQKLISELLDKHPHVSEETRVMWQEALEHNAAYSVLIHTVLGTPAQHEWYFARAVQDVKVIEIDNYLDRMTPNWVRAHPIQTVETIHHLNSKVQQLMNQLK